MPQFTRFQVGQAVPGWPVASWDLVGDLVERDAANQLPLAQPGRAPRLPPERVINLSGSALDEPFGVLKLARPLNDPGLNAGAALEAPVWEGEAIDQEVVDGEASFAVLQEPAPANRDALATIYGLTWVRLDVENETDRLARPILDDSTKLRTGDSGVPIVWKESGTGDKLGRVLLGGGGGGVAGPSALKPMLLSSLPEDSLDVARIPAAQITPDPETGYPQLTWGTAEAYPWEFRSGRDPNSPHEELRGATQTIYNRYPHDVNIEFLNDRGLLIYVDQDNFFVTSACDHFDMTEFTMPPANPNDP